MKRLWLALTVLVGGALVACVMLVARRDLEDRDLDDAARREVPGRYVALSSGMTHYEVFGPETGRVVVLLHGNTVPGYIWDPTPTFLAAEGFRVIRYDRLGRGWTDRPNIAYTQSVYVQQFTELLDSLHIRGPVDVAGLSLGGSIITSIAAAHPERLRSMIYVDPGFRRVRTLPLPMRINGLADLFMTVAVVPSMLDQASDFLHPDMHPAWNARYLGPLHLRGYRRALLSDIREGATWDQWPEVERVGALKIPTLIVWGKQDPTVPFANSDALRRAIPQAEFVAVDSAGHLPHIEQPAVVTPAIVAFLRHVPATVASPAAAH